MARRNISWRVALFGLAVGAVSGCATVGETAGLPGTADALPPGSTLHWMMEGEGMDSAFMNIVIARGDDFTIFYDPEYLQDVDEDDLDPAEAYGVEFSGIYYAGCDEAMPSAETRAALVALREAPVGDAYKSKGDGLSIIVGEDTARSVNGMGVLEARIFDVTHAGEDGGDERMQTSLTLDVAIASSWDGASDTVVVGITVPREPRALLADHIADLGACAALVTPDKT